MSATWSQGGHPSGSVQNNSGPFQGPPPICFKCGGEHYVVACPHQTASNPAGPPFSAVFNNQQDGHYGRNGGLDQMPQWGNGQNGSVPAQFPNPKVPPVVTRYVVPGVNPPVANTHGLYGPPVAAHQYQQYPGSAPPAQSYPPPQPSYTPNPHSYGPTGAPQAYNQPPPQSYSASPTGPPYANPRYQPPPQNQYYQNNGPPQYGASTYQNPPQHFAPTPAVPPYQPSNSYPPQTAPYPYAEPPSDQIQPSQWNNTASASSYSASPSQQPNIPQFPAGIKREFSGTPRQHPAARSTSNIQQTQQTEYGSARHQTAPQTVASVPKSAWPTSASMNQNPPSDLTRPPSTMARTKSSSSSNASHTWPASRPTSSSGNCHKGESQSVASSVITAEVADTSMEGDELLYEDGELTEDDLTELEFKWELDKIFSEQPPTENVCLAQPLSTTWESTPVPLLDQRLNNSVSRYARKDNLKDFMRPIRSQPQWSYLQEDPAFSDLKLDESLVLFQEVPAWMAARHGVDFYSPRSSRKRARSEVEVKAEQEDTDNQINLESASEYPSGNKRPKNESDIDTIIFQTSNSPTRRPGTPTFVRAGSPSSAAEGDVWAPQPGECASAPVDPTEALLASLGVSGSPKPVRKPAGPPLSIPGSGRNSPSFAGMPQSMSPSGEHNPAQYNTPPGQAPNMTPQQFNPPPYGSSANGNTQQGQFTNSISQHGNHSYGISPHGPHHGQLPNGMPQQTIRHYNNQQYNVSRQNSYGSGISPQGNPPYTGQPYGMPRQNSFGSGVSAHGSLPNGNHQYGVPRQNSYGNGMPQQQTPPFATHPSAIPHQQYPPQSHYGPPDPAQVNAQYGSVVHAQASAPYGPPQQNTAIPNQSYSMPTQPYPSQSHFSNGMLPQNDSSHSHANFPHSRPGFGNQTNGIRKRSLNSLNNNPQGHALPRQDSGYVSARGSYSNGSGTNHGFPSMPPLHRNQEQQEQPAPQHPQPEQQVNSNNNTDAAPEPEETNFFASLPSQFPRKEKTQKPKVQLEEHKIDSANTSENDPGESPLTPTSLEILGKLIPNNDCAGKKIKRPQPVVEAAYSRRW